MPRLDGYSVLRQREYRRYWLGQWVSLIGTWMQSAAQGWLLIRLTGQPAYLGYLGAATAAPMLVFVLFAGTITDRIDRRRIILTTQALALVQALALALLTLAGHIQPWQIIALAGVLGSINAFDIPSRQAFVAELVAPESLANAVALNSSAFNIARVVGPGIAGLLLAAVGEGYCFLINAVSYVAVLWSLWTIRPQFVRPRPPRAETGRAIVEGLRYVRQHESIGPILLLVAFTSQIGVSYRNFLPAMARNVLGANEWQYGFMMAAAGVGASVGGLMIAALRMDRDTYRRLLPVSVLFFALALISFSAVRTYWLSVVVLTVVGVGGILYFNCSNSLIQLSVDDHYRGRVLGVYTLMHQGMATFGNLLLGVVATRWGTPWALGSGALVTLVAGATFALTVDRTPVAETEHVAGVG